jgi:molybdopterin biosynthesis enzyme
VEARGGEALNLGIAPDNVEALGRLTGEARGADLLVTTGGVSVGEHDLVRSALGDRGLSLDFWKIAMRPGKPLLFGTIGDTPILGLPGNPVSSLVCAIVFLGPALDAMQGLGQDHQPAMAAVLGAPLGANDRRQDYLLRSPGQLHAGHPRPRRLPHHPPARRAGRGRRRAGRDSDPHRRCDRDLIGDFCPIPHGCAQKKTIFPLDLRLEPN